MPMVSAGGPAGVIGLAWSTQRAVDETERLLLFTAAKLGAESLRRCMREAERRRLLLRISDAADQERLSIAADLHDDPIQRLAALSMRLGSLRASGQPIDPDDLEPVELGMQEVLASLRDLIFDLHPPDVGRLTLAQSIEDYATWLLGDSIPVTIISRLGAGRVGEEVPTGHLRTSYRIVQEALTNVWKHAGASVATVELVATDGRLTVRVDDDGRGMAEGQYQRERGHIGLQTIRERAESLGGSMRTGTSPSGGFRLEVVLPWA
jgi:signal transduction histidine kinase